jgi:hypothetical protein
MACQLIYPNLNLTTLDCCFWAATQEGGHVVQVHFFKCTQIGKIGTRPYLEIFALECIQPIN